MAERPFLQPLRILIVDDCHDTTDSLATLVKCWGHEAHIAHTGPEALSLVEQRKPHVVLLDLGLPGMDGLEVARKLQAAQKVGGPLVIAVSGYGREEDKECSWKAGCHLHLTKPADPDVLRYLLSKLQHGDEHDS